MLIDEIQAEARGYLKRLGEVEKRGNRDFLSSYADGYLNGVVFAQQKLERKCGECLHFATLVCPHFDCKNDDPAKPACIEFAELIKDLK